jgi:predicted kinase
MGSTNVIVSIGISGAGKTYFLKKFASKLAELHINSFDIKYISPDDIRAQLRKWYALDNKIPLKQAPSEQEFSDQAWSIAYKILAEAISCGVKYVVFDATLAYFVDRSDFLNRCRLPGVKVTGIYFDTPLAVCIERQNNPDRDRHVKSQALSDMAEALSQDPPTLEDGFSYFFKAVPVNK